MVKNYVPSEDVGRLHANYEPGQAFSQEDVEKKAKDLYNQHFNELGGASLSGPGGGVLHVSGSEEARQGGLEGLELGQMLYGQGISDVGKEAADYSKRVKGLLDTDYAKADVYRQGANRRIEQSANRLGMAGASMGGAKEQAYRQSGMEAAAMNQDYRDKALALYGRNIGAKQQGMTSTYFGAKGTGQANTPTPVASSDSGMCCFIFLEARYGNGLMDSVVRKYRDEHMTQKNRRGYYKLSEVLVPMMRKHRLAKFLVQSLMTTPMFLYGKYHYNQGKFGFIFKPVVKFWMNTFDYLGTDHEFIRENGEVC